MTVFDTVSELGVSAKLCFRPWLHVDNSVKAPSVNVICSHPSSCSLFGTCIVKIDRKLARMSQANENAR